MKDVQDWQTSPIIYHDRAGLPIAEVRGKGSAEFILRACKNYDLLLDAVVKTNAYFIATSTPEMATPEFLQLLCDKAGLAVRLALAAVNQPENE